MPSLRRDPVKKEARRAALDAARDRRREALTGGPVGSGIHWQADTNPLNRETYWATNGLDKDHPEYTVVHVTRLGSADRPWVVRTWVGDARDVRSYHPSLAAAKADAEEDLATPRPAPAWDEASWADASSTTHAPQSAWAQTWSARSSGAKPCGARTRAGGSCRNLGDCPHHP